MNYLIRKMKEQVKWGIYLLFFLHKYPKKIRKDLNSLIFVGTPCYGNLGDQGIAYAAQQFLKEEFPSRNVIEIPIGFIEMYTGIFKFLLSKQLVLICGGGFIGSQWEWGNWMICKVIKKFHDNRIVILPQTLFFEKNKKGEQCLKTVKRVYSEHKNLTICCREEMSYQFALKEFVDNKALFIPDMVTYLDYKEVSGKRSGIMLILRSDCEQVVEERYTEKLAEAFSSEFNASIIHSNNIVPEFIKPSEREEKVRKRLAEISACQLVITDRLHGMLFATVTGTPCLALANGNGKVEGVYNTIKTNPYVVFSDGSEDINKLTERFQKILYGRYRYNNSVLRNDIIRLGDFIKSDSGDVHEA